MKEKVVSLLLAVVLIYSAAVPGFAAELEDGLEPAPLTWSVLNALLAQEEEPFAEPSAEPEKPVTMEELMAFVLRQSGMKDSQLGSFPKDWVFMAQSADLFRGLSYQADAVATTEDLAVMTANAKPLYDAMHAEKREPLFINGLAQPIFEYTTGEVLEGYSNADSQIIRFFVFVETNYDTDGDGKLDLVKALVQLPRAAAEGDYQAATIYEARPYITGCTDYFGYSPDLYDLESGYDISKMYSQPPARVPAGTATTADAAANAQASDWYYYNPYEGIMDYEDLNWYDYYLVRGFAVVECGGLGTRDSEGFETCGSDLEIDAFKCVIEWLHGDRVAYTDKTSNLAISADWSNGKVGMTGLSYGGTTQFGLATTGVAGLETIVPVSGIASWYEYTNSQGISTYALPSYSDLLSVFCAGRYLDEEDWNSIKGEYGKYLGQLYNDERALKGDYGDHWAIRDYTRNPENIRCPALIVHGLNDDNVRTKNFDLMYKAYQQAGAEAKLLLHQDGHAVPNKIAIGEESYYTIVNRWFSHYLYGVENGAESMAAVTVQSNVDGSWHTYDSWEPAASIIMDGEASDNLNQVVTISNNNVAANVSYKTWREQFLASSTGSSLLYRMETQEDLVIGGPVAVHIRAASNAAATDAVQLTAMLVDTAPNGETFPVFNRSGEYLPYRVVQEGGAWMGGGLESNKLVEYTQTNAAYKVIGQGWLDLCNPEADYSSASAARENRITLNAGTFHDYTLYIQPSLYTVPKGHTLSLVVYMTTPLSVKPANEYSVTVDNTASYVQIPLTCSPKGPYIIAQPENHVGEIGSVATFHVETVGENLTYQWYMSANGGYSWSRNGNAGCTTDTLRIPMLASRVGYQFKCIITGEDGRTLETEPAYMDTKVHADTSDELAILEQPQDHVGPVGSAAKFHVTAQGKGLTYQWYMSANGGTKWTKNGNSGCTTDTLGITMTSSRVGYLFKCVITDINGEKLETEPVYMDTQIHVAPPAELVISEQPQSHVGPVGSAATFHVTASGDNLTYQWMFSVNNGASWVRNGNTGSTTDTLRLTMLASRVGYLYKCVITDEHGVIKDSDVVYMDTEAHPEPTSVFEILEQPQDHVGEVGSAATFRVKATGDGLTYQWMFSANGGQTWVKSGNTGSTTDTLRLTMLASRVGYLYKCVITDANGETLETDPAAMRIE